MIVSLETPSQKRNTRIKLYKDDVFLIAQETIKKQDLSMSIENLFASADQFTEFLLENDLKDRDVMQFEIDDLRAEISDDKTFYHLMALSFVKLCALRKAKSNAEQVARALVGFCQEYDGFSDLLKQLSKKEHERWYENKRADLLTYELRCIEKEDRVIDGDTIISAIVDSASGLSSDNMQSVEITLSEVNDKFNHQFQGELDRLRETRKMKSVSTINIDRVNDIHDNPNVNIGNK